MNKVLKALLDLDASCGSLVSSILSISSNSWIGVAAVLCVNVPDIRPPLMPVPPEKASICAALPDIPVSPSSFLFSIDSCNLSFISVIWFERIAEVLNCSNPAFPLEFIALLYAFALSGSPFSITSNSLKVLLYAFLSAVL